MFRRILVANRGEIALRVIRAARELGIETVAVYSRADRDASYLHLANDAVCIGGELPSASYLNPAAILSAAEITNAEAIHPGYGFLSENATFAQMCRDCNVEFIGPPADAMRRLGDKVQAKALARKAKVPLVPGSDGVVADEEQALEIAQRVGYPVMIKAAAGGGGRGMRAAAGDAALRTHLRNARAEAENAFKDGSLYIEKLIERPRHVEVQVLGDPKGHVVHLWERDCSLQRRHQKLVEESPSPHIDRKVRERLCAAAVRLAKAAGYYSAGTCEFLLDLDGNFYFIEVNARIQVEHPVTELVTGVDLVQWQIRIAAGEELRLTQADIERRGSAVEVRVNAESPEDGFRPCPGPVREFIPPGGPGVRVDTHVYAGCTISPYYDSLVAKLLVHRPTRAEAIIAMRRAIEEFRIAPIKTTLPVHRLIFEHADFVRGQVDTGFIEREIMPALRAG